VAATRGFFVAAWAAVVLWQPGVIHGEVVAPPLARPQDQSRFQVGVFATGLEYPTSMATLADGSLLVATSKGGPSWLDNYIFASQSGALVRLVDADGDGVADGPPQTVAANLPGLVTSVRREGNLVFALSSQGGKQAILIWRTGASPADSLEPAGRLSFAFPAGHSTYTLATRPSEGGGTEVYFNIRGGNSASSPPEVTVGISALDGATFTDDGTFQLAANSVHRVTVFDDSGTIAVAPPQQIARGLRNAAGIVFDSQGNLWLQDNGIDASEPHVSLSADELNMIPAAALGATVYDFGFGTTYVDYATGATVGPTEGTVEPLVAFRPLAGEKSEGAVELAWAPESFPGELAGGLLVAFSGKFHQGGSANDENPLVLVNTADNSYFHFIENQIMGHPNGLLSTADALYLSDLNYLGLFGNAGGTNPAVPADQQGVVYRITYVPEAASRCYPLAAVAVLICRAAVAVRRRARRGDRRKPHD